jgi:hypothetical protein
MNILEFYKNHSVDSDFDECFYQKKYQDVSGYYLPYAKDNGFSEKQRLFHHYFLYGKKEGRFRSLKDEVAQYKGANQLSYAPVSNLSAVVGLKNRSRVLQASINFWLMKPEIKEIVIVDCSSSDFNSKYFESLDKRIKIIRLHDEEYFNLSKVYNIGIENCTYENILKLDVDYILNPYIDLCDWLSFDLES